MIKCPKCGYVHQKNPVGRPKNFNEETEKEIVKDRESGMTFQQLAHKNNCSIGTIQRVLKDFNKLSSYEHIEDTGRGGYGSTGK